MYNKLKYDYFIFGTYKTPIVFLNEYAIFDLMNYNQLVLI